MLKQITAAIVIASLLVVLGCTVIRTEHKIEAHITLDIRHIEEQVDDIFDFVEGETDTLPPLEAAGPESSLRQRLRWLDPCPVACAQEDMKNTSALVKEIATRLRERHARVQAVKDNGCFGENNRGYLELRDCEDLADADYKNRVQQLMAEENKDRKALFNELARLNHDSGATVSTMETVGAMSKLKRAGQGEWVQLPEPGKEFDEVKASSLGKKLGTECRAGAWVRMP